MVPFALKSWQLISYVSNRAKVGLGRQHRNSPRMRTLAPPPGHRSTRLPLLPAPSIVHGVLAPTRSRQHGCLNRTPGIRNWEMFCWGNDWRYSVVERKSLKEKKHNLNGRVYSCAEGDTESRRMRQIYLHLKSRGA